MNKFRIIFLLSFAIILFSLCFILPSFLQSKAKKIVLENNYIEFITRESFITRQHVKILPEYDTDSTIAFENQDGSQTLYVFMAPIRYAAKDGRLISIDSRLTNIQDENMLKNGYLYTVANNNIESFYPQELSGKYQWI